MSKPNNIEVLLIIDQAGRVNMIFWVKLKNYVKTRPCENMKLQKNNCKNYFL